MALSRILSATLLLLVALIARADAVDEFIDTLAAIGSMQGDFTQLQYSEQGEFVGRSSGHFKLLRGGYFSWEITAPDSQIIVATPAFLWHHDRDLETVTRRPVAGQDDMAPLRILGGEPERLRTEYAISATGENSFRFDPRRENADFRQLEVTLVDGLVTHMSVVDRLNQKITLDFSNVSREETLTPADFDFQPPPDADLFYYDE